MIGAFARRFASDEAVREVEVEGESWRLRGAKGAVAETKDPDAVPEPFAQAYEDEGGKVVVSPILEAFRRAFRRKSSD